MNEFIAESLSDAFTRLEDIKGIIWNIDIFYMGQGKYKVKWGNDISYDEV